MTSTGSNEFPVIQYGGAPEPLIERIHRFDSFWETESPPSLHVEYALFFRTAGECTKFSIAKSTLAGSKQWHDYNCCYQLVPDDLLKFVGTNYGCIFSLYSPRKSFLPKRLFPLFLRLQIHETGIKPWAPCLQSINKALVCFKNH